MPEAGGFDAGSIFLQVVPSLRGFHEAMRKAGREAEKEFADEFGKSPNADRAGKAWGDAAGKGVGGAGSKAGDEFSKNFERNSTKGLSAFEREAHRAMSRAGDSFGDSVDRNIAEIQTRIRSLGKARIGVDMDAGAFLAESAAIEAAIRKINGRKASVDVRINTGRALAEVAALNAMVSKLDGSNRRLGGTMGFLQNATNGTANEFRTFSPLVLAAVTAGTALIPVLAAAAGGLAALATAGTGVVAGLGVMVLGFSGLGDALGAMTKVSDQAGYATEEAATKMASASRAIADAERNLARARVDAARATADSSRRVKEAVQAAAQAENDANRSVTRVMQEAAQAQADANRNVTEAVQDAAQAQADASRNVTEAVQAAAQAQADANRNVARTTQDAAQAQADANRNVAEAVRDAAQAQADANRNVTEATQDAARAQADAAKMVADAREAASRQIQSAIDTQISAEESLANAVQGVQDAERNLADARETARQEQADEADNTLQLRLNERRAVLDLFNAQVAFNAARSDGAATNAEQESAAIAYRQAQLDLKNIREAQKGLNEERRVGIKDNEGVKTAQDALVSALEAQQQAEEDLGTASAAVSQARLDAADLIAEALLDQNRIIADGQRAIADAERDRRRQIGDSATAVANAERDRRRQIGDSATAVADAERDRRRQIEDSAAAVSAAELDRRRQIKEGAAAVADAESDRRRETRDSTQAIADAERDRRRQIKDSAAAVAEAQRSERRQHDDSRRSIADAMRSLSSAQRDYQDDLKETEEVGTTAMRALETAMGKLSPAGRRFVRYLFGLRDEFYKLRAAAQTGMLPGVQDAIERLRQKYFPGLLDFIRRMGDVLGDVFKRLGKRLTSPVFEDFFGRLSDLGPKFMRQFGKTTINWLTIFARLMKITMPFAQSMSKGFLELSRNVLAWTKSKEGTEGWREFMEYAFRVGPMVLSLLGSFVGAFLHLSEALAPVGELISKMLIAVFDFIAGMDVDVLRGLAVALLAMAFGIQIMSGVAIVAAQVITILTSTFALWAFAIAVAVAGLVGLYASSERARTIINAVGHAIEVAFRAMWKVVKPILTWIGDRFGDLMRGIQNAWNNGGKQLWEDFKDQVETLWVDYVKPLFGKVGDAWEALVRNLRYWWYRGGGKELWVAVQGMLKDVWEDYVKPLFGKIGEAWQALVKDWRHWWYRGGGKELWAEIQETIKELWEDYAWPFLKKVWEYFGKVAKGIKWFWDHILKQVFILVGDVVVKLWKDIIEPNFGSINDAWDDLAWEVDRLWNKVLKPVFEAFKLWWHGDGAIQNLVKGGVDLIKKHWELVANIFAVPIAWVLDIVINKGIIWAFNKVADWANSSAHIDEIPLDSIKNGLARGGIAFPDRYTPGKDIGYIGVSGGEAVMRPEWTRAVGADEIDRMNRAAREGGIAGVRQYLGGYKMGGIIEHGGRSTKGKELYWPTLGRATSTYSGHDGVDINGPQYGDRDTGNPIYAFRDGVISYSGWEHGYGNAIFEQVTGGPQVVYGHGSAVYVKAGDRVQAGDLIGRVGNTGHSFGAHLHFGIPGGTYSQAMALLSGAFRNNAALAAAGSAYGMAADEGGLFSGGWGWIKDLVTNPTGYLTDKIDDMLGGKLSGGGALIEILAEVPAKLIGIAVDKIKDLGGALLDRVKDIAPTPGVDPRLPGMVRMQAEAYGWTGSQWDALNKIIMSESGYDPTAQNPNSTAYGMFQFLDSTWATVGGTKTSVPATQTIYGLRYIKDRYGNPIDAWDFHQTRGYYSEGGIVPDNPAAATMYDRGGYLPPGLTTVLNATGSPEPVFTSEQWDAIMSGQGGGGTVINVPMMPTNSTPDAVADAVLFAVRRSKFGGVYRGSPV